MKKWKSRETKRGSLRIWESKIIKIRKKGIRKEKSDLLTKNKYQ
jgi:hypothetical protein